MKTLIVKEIDGDKFTLADKKSQEEYKLSLKFYDLSNIIEAGDYITFHEKLLDKKFSEYSTFYQFGPLEEPYGRKIKSDDDVDLISICYRNKDVVLLKRFFG